MSKDHSASRRRPSDSKQLRRQWALVRLLSTAGRSFSVKQLAEQLCVSKSNIERDLATLEEQFPLVEEANGKQKRSYRISQRPRELDAIRPFGTMQLLALYVALEMMRPLAETPFYDDLKSVVQTVRALLAERHNGGLDRLATVFRAVGAVAANDSHDAELIDDLVDAVAQRKTCSVELQAEGAEPRELGEILPVQLAWRDNALEVKYRRAGDVGTRSVRVRELAKVTPVRAPGAASGKE